MAFAMIGGTGVYDPHVLSNRERRRAETPYGPIEVEWGTYEGAEVAFLPRHGQSHSIPPHKINHRANLAGLKLLGVTRVFATAAVGSLNPDMKPGDFVVIDQFIDYTKARQPVTFFDGAGDHGDGSPRSHDSAGGVVGGGDYDGDVGDGIDRREGGGGRDTPTGDLFQTDEVVHTDVTEPYCSELRSAAIEISTARGLRVHPHGVYLTVDGPRYETAAEIKMYRMWGADVIGMTNAPEAILAREAGLCYGTVATVTNMAAGMSADVLSHDEVAAVMAANTEHVRAVIMQSMLRAGLDRRCACGPMPTEKK